MPRLIYIMKESGDPSLRLSAFWAVKNVLRKTSTETKRDVMSYLGWSHLVEYVFFIFFLYLSLLTSPFSSRLLGDSDGDVQEQAFNVVRNLTESEDGIAMVFKEVGKEVLGHITAGLRSGNDNVVLQVFPFSSTILYYIYIINPLLTNTHRYTYFVVLFRTLGSFCTRQHVEWNRRTTRLDSVLPESPLRSPSLSFRSQGGGSWPCSILHP